MSLLKCFKCVTNIIVFILVSLEPEFISVKYLFTKFSKEYINKIWQMKKKIKWFTGAIMRIYKLINYTSTFLFYYIHIFMRTQ